MPKQAVLKFDNRIMMGLDALKFKVSLYKTCEEFIQDVNQVFAGWGSAPATDNDEKELTRFYNTFK